MHVLHLVDALHLGGAERMLVELANRTVLDGHRASVCVSRSGTALASQLRPEIELLVLGRERRADVRPLVRLARWIRSHAVDVVHCHGLSSFSLAALVSATRAFSAPLLMHDHRGFAASEAVPRWFRFARRRLVKYVAVDEAQLDWAQRAGIAADDTCVIPNAVDMASVWAQRLRGAPLPVVPGIKRIVSVGGLRREKAIDVLLESMALVRAPVRLFVIGGDADRAYADTCRQRSERSDLRDRVTFLGQREDAAALAATADLAVHSSRAESGPLVLIEYAAVGTPFVSTRVGGVATTLAKLGVGTFVPAEDPIALAHAIDAELARPSGDRAVKIAELATKTRETFDVARVMPRWYQLYTEAASA